MLDKLAARSSAVLHRTSHHPIGRLLLTQSLVKAYPQLGIFFAFCVLGIIIIWPTFGQDYPSGVDTATFLHLSWVTKLALSGDLANPLQDPYWYGGFPYLQAYPPLGYGLVGVISFVTRIDLIGVSVALLVMAYGGLATATYWLAVELGLRRWTAALAGVLTTLAYPVLSSIFLWGWFTSMLALPIGLVGFMLLERSLRTGNRGLSAWGGACMAASILTHHMTGISLGLGIAGWFLYHALSAVYSRRQVLTHSALFTAVTALIVAPWGIPFTIHILDVAFRREIPGLWLPTLNAYSSNIVDSSLIGGFVYPSYLGITILVLATGGTVYTLIERKRLAGVAITLLVLAWFSMGSDLNPLIRVYPFSALDVARFHLFMVPFMTLLGAALVERTFGFLRDIWPSLAFGSRSWSHRADRARWGVMIVVTMVILIFPIIDALKARDHMSPYQVDESVAQAMSWLAREPPPDDETQGRVYAVGLWNWHTFLVPYTTGHLLVDGWHDEGAPNVNQVRQLRIMGWTANVDIETSHSLLVDLGATYVLVKRVPDYPLENSHLFWDGFQAHTEWYAMQEQWGDVAVFRVLR